MVTSEMFKITLEVDYKIDISLQLVLILKYVANYFYFITDLQQK